MEVIIIFQSMGININLMIYFRENDQIETLIWFFDSHANGCNGITTGWGCVEKI